MTYFSYLHAKPNTSDISGIFYVGKGKSNRHLSFKNRSKFHQSVIDKYGADEILVSKIECSSEKIAFDLERGLIKCLRRSGVKLTNLTDGGEGASGHRHQGMSREKHLAALDRINSNLTSENRSINVLKHFSKFEKGESPQAKQFLKMGKDVEINKVRSEKSTAANLINWQDEEIRNKRIAGMIGKKKTMSDAALESRRVNAKKAHAARLAKKLIKI